MLAAADLLVRGGERVGLLGLSRALATRDIVDRLAEFLLVESRRVDAQAELPPAEALSRAHARHSRRRLFWSRPKYSPNACASPRAGRAGGALMMIADPVEETFPFSGHVEFLDVD